MQTNNSSSPPSCLNIASPPSSPPSPHNIKRAFHKHDSLELASFCFHLNLITFLVSLPAPCLAAEIQTAGLRLSRWLTKGQGNPREQHYLVNWSQHKTHMVAHPDGRLGGTPDKKLLKCNDAVRLIFWGGCVILTPLFILMSRSYIIQLRCCSLGSQVYHLKVYCKWTYLCLCSLILRWISVLYILCEVKHERAGNYQQHLWAFVYAVV